jgi:hypothetical protein
MSLFDRLKVWDDEENLTDEDLNDEIDNVLDHLTAEYLVGWSSTVGQMQVTTSPGAVGTESLAASVSDELERLRYCIARITGENQWYSAPDMNLSAAAAILSQAGAFPDNRVTSGRARTGSNQSIFLVPGGNTTSVAIKAGGSNPNLEYYVDGIAYTLSSDVTKTGLTTAPAANNTCLVDDAALVGAISSKIVGENNVYGQWNGSNLTVDTMGSNVTALVGKIAAFKVGAEYFLAFVESTTRLSRAYRGFFFDSSSNPVVRVAINNNDTITLMKLAWLFITTAGAVDVTYTNPAWQGTAPDSPATGDYWFDSVNGTWKKYDGASWNAANATFIGMTVQDGTNCVAARSVEFFATPSDLSSVMVGVFGNSEVRSTAIGPKINVAGSLIDFGVDFAKWTNPTHLDSGVVIGVSSTYYLYVTNTGKAIISDVYPYVRDDLLGLYHPYHTWRCVGSVTTDGSSNFTSVVSFSRIDGARLNDLSITATQIGAGAVTTSKILDQNVTDSKRATLVSNTSASCNVFTHNNQAFVQVTNLSVVLPTIGRPVLLAVVPGGDPNNSAQASAWGALSTAVPTGRYTANNASIAVMGAMAQLGSANTIIYGHATLLHVDPAPAVGNTTYAFQIQSPTNGVAVGMQYMKLIAVQL